MCIIGQKARELHWMQERPHGSIDDLTPVGAEEVNYAARNELTPTG